MAFSKQQNDQLKKRIAFNSVFKVISHDMADLSELISLTEKYLKSESKKLGRRVANEIKKLPNNEEKEYMTGWYAYDFNRLDKVFPIIQRRSLFLTLMSKTEANLLLACRICKHIFKLEKSFEKKRKNRLISQALSYLQENLSINEQELQTSWQFIQELWTIRNVIVHNDGIPKLSDLEQILKFCAPIPTIELDNDNRVIFKEGFVQIALQYVKQFFILLQNEVLSIFLCEIISCHF